MVRYPVSNRKAKRKAWRRNKVNLGSLSRDCSNCDEERKEEMKGAEHPSTWICFHSLSLDSGGSFYEIYKAGGAGAVYC